MSNSNPNHEVTLQESNDDGIRTHRFSLNVAEGFFGRLSGLMFRSPAYLQGGLMFNNTNMVHTFWMRFSIDLVFIDNEYRIVKLMPGIKPWRAARSAHANHVIEMHHGEIFRLGIKVGDKIKSIGDIE